MSTTKRYTGPIVVGMKMVKVAHYGRFTGDPIGTVEEVSTYTKEVHEDNDARHAYHPVDAPAEKRERVLAPGWAATGSGNCFSCATPAPHRFSQPAGPGRRTLHCEPCAEAAGAFAPPAPAKTCSKARCGEPMERGLTCGALFGVGGMCYCDFSADVYWCSAACRDAARAKPAEPKPAPTCDHKTNAKCAVPGGCAEAKEARALLAKPAPAEKAKREWVRQLEGATLTADSPYAKWAALQTGVAPGLEREKRAINVRGVRSIYLPPTESQGERLSRLVESGLRADVRQDETRFEAGMRGRR